MESHSQQSYPNSGESSPHSREIDCDNSPSWNDPVASYKVKFMCSYGGKIQPRPHDNQLSYVGGDTKILAIERNSKFAAVIAKLSSLCDSAPSGFCFKYQLPGEDLDALISVTNDEDLEHMMVEYDRLCRSSVKPARLRIFLFKANKPEGNWFIDALNPVQLRPLEVSSSPNQVNSDSVNPDFLFGFDKASEPDSGEPPVATIENKVEKLQIDEEVEKSVEDAKPKVQEKVTPATMATSANYWPERQNHPVSGSIAMEQQPIYIIQNLPGVYHQNPSIQQPPSGVQPGHGYYNMPRVIPEVYCDHSIYNTVTQPPRVNTMMTEQGYKVCYDYAGRPLYYAVPVSGLPPPSQPQQTTAAVVDVRSVAPPDVEVAAGNLAQTTAV